MYLDRVELYFDANEFPNGKQVAILLTSIGASTYALLSASKEPKSKTLVEITAMLKKYYELKLLLMLNDFLS